MANETLYSNFITVAAYVDAHIIPVLRAKVIMPMFCRIVNLDNGSNSKQLRQKNAQTAVVVAEATAATAAVYQHTSPATLLAKKCVVVNEPSEESEKFAGASLSEITAEQGEACAAKVDVDAMALFAGFSNTVGVSGADLTVAQLIQAAYFVRAADAGAPIVYVLHPMQTYDVQKEIVASSAPVWSNPALVSLLQAAPQANGYRGTFMGADVYDSTRVATANGGADRAGACLVPGVALALANIGGTDTIVQDSVLKRTKLVSTDLYYDVKEAVDGAGCAIITDA